MKRVLVTGATGFIGQNALARLVEHGYEIHATFRGRKVPVAGVEWHPNNLMDPESTERLLVQVAPTHLLHLAWYTEHGKFWSSPVNLDWVAASLFLLRAFQKSGGSRVVIAGTCAEYDWNEEICKENATPLRPLTLYGVSKNSLREIAERFAAESGLSFAWGRVFFLYGPNEAPNRLVPLVTRALLKGEEVPCSSGDQTRDFLHVEDAAAAFAALLDGEIEGAVNVASGEGVKVRDVITRIGTLIGRPDLIRLGKLPDRGADPRCLVADTARLRSELHWRPRWSLESGLANAVDWWRTQYTLSEN